MNAAVAREQAMELFDLTDRTALVTGAAGGLGGAQVEALMQAGAHVVATDLEAEPIKRRLARSGLPFKRLTALELDITDEERIAACVQHCEREFGGIDILSNNAAVSLPAPLIDYALADFDRTIAVNLRGLFAMSRDVAGSMTRQGRGGSIINIASIGGMVVDGPTSAAYDASKAAVIQLTRNLAVELAPAGIRANAIAPGYMFTDMTERYTSDPDYMERLTTSKIPLGRVGHPREIGGATVFLASDAASYVTGHTLNVDGGWVAI